MTFGIIGFGRFGKLWASALAPYGHVLVYDKNEIENKSEFGGLDFVGLEEVVKVDMLFLLVPISEMKNCCLEIKSLLNSNTVVIDACSVKVYPSKIMQEVLSDKQPIIATHPLFGPDSATHHGLGGHKIVVCPIRSTKEQKKVLIGLFNDFGLEIIEATPDEHDLQMARSQALVHFIGRGLTELNLQEQAISTPDYASLLAVNSMVQNDTWQLFFDMQKFNPYTKDIRDKFVQGLKKIEDKIKQ